MCCAVTCIIYYMYKPPIPRATATRCKPRRRLHGPLSLRWFIRFANRYPHSRQDGWARASPVGPLGRRQARVMARVGQCIGLFLLSARVVQDFVTCRARSFFSSATCRPFLKKGPPITPMSEGATLIRGQWVTHPPRPVAREAKSAQGWPELHSLGYNRRVKAHPPQVMSMEVCSENRSAFTRKLNLTNFELYNRPYSAPPPTRLTIESWSVCSAYDRRDTRDGKIRGGIYQEYPRYIPYHGYIPVYFVRYPRIMAHAESALALLMIKCTASIGFANVQTCGFARAIMLENTDRHDVRRIRLRRHSNARLYFKPGQITPPAQGLLLQGRYGAMPGMGKWGVVYARYIPVYTSRGIWHGIYPGGHTKV